MSKKIPKDVSEQSFKLVRDLIDSVIFEERRVRIKRDVFATLDLVTMMQNCSIALDHLGYKCDMEAMHMLRGIVRYLS